MGRRGVRFTFKLLKYVHTSSYSINSLRRTYSAVADEATRCACRNLVVLLVWHAEPLSMIERFITLTYV